MRDLPRTLKETIADLERPDNGPLTCFVVMHRACALCALPGVDTELVANALHASLDGLGWLADDNTPLPTGS